MQRRTSSPVIPTWVALVLTAVGAAAAAWQAELATGWVAAVFAAAGAGVATLAWVQSALRASEVAELEEIEELKRSRPEAALFGGGGSSLRARSTRVMYERWGRPAGTLGLSLAQGGGVAGMWRWLGGVGPRMVPEKTTLAMAFFGLLALVCYLLGRYGVGLGKSPEHRWLRAGASHLLLVALVLALAIGAAAVGWFGYPELDRTLARVLVGVMGLVVLESLVMLVLELYRPRQRDGEARPIYESRVIGLLGQPGGLFSTLSQALDYQFGFSVSETWFYRWLERAFAWLVLLQAGVLWGASCLVILDPHEEAILERFGRRVADRGVLQPGLHFKWPWPIEVARVFSTREVRLFNVGFVPDPKKEGERTLLWTRPHYLEEVNLLVASREQSDFSAGGRGGGGNGSETDTEQSVPVNLLTVSIPVQYRITNVLQWAYGLSDPAQTLELMATREVAHHLVSVDIEAIMSVGRMQAARELREAIQRRSVERGLGVEILLVGLQDIHPPVQVASAYEAVIGATQERETTIQNARAYQAERVPLAEAESVRRVHDAESFRVLQSARARGTSGMFTNQMLAHAASPSVYVRRAYLDAVVRGMSGARKYLVTTTNLQADYWVNLEDKLRPDLLDVTVPGARGETKQP